MKKVIFCLLFNISYLMINQVAFAQEDLMNLLEENVGEETQLVEATFKASRLINGQTIITRKQNQLEFLISHRFGTLNSGAYELFGLDNSNIRLGLEYGIFDQLTVGVGRNSFEKTYDGFLKYALVKQQKGAVNIPISFTLFGSAAVKTLKPIDPDQEIDFKSKVTYVAQGLLASKINSFLSLQLMPTMIHRNVVTESEENDQFALGVGGRIKLTNRVSLNGEYYYRLPGSQDDEYLNSMAIGFDIETGGHVFQLHLTNSRAMIEKGFITETSGDFFDGDIHFGFNISRVF